MRDCLAVGMPQNLRGLTLLLAYSLVWQGVGKASKMCAWQLHLVAATMPTDYCDILRRLRRGPGAPGMG